MPSQLAEESLERVLNLFTKTPRPAPKRIAFRKRGGGFASAPSQGRAESVSASPMRKIVATDNCVAMGISEKVSEGKRSGTLAITFYVERKLPKGKLSPEHRIPAEVPEALSRGESILTDVKEIGRLRPELNARRKPFQPGNSIGHVDAGAGTLGAVVTRDGEFYILSNSHVLALSGLARRGDAIVYPGSIDGGASEDLVAKLARFKKFKLGSAFVNRVDCAIAKPTPERLGDLMAEIKGLGLPGRTTKPVRGMKVTKVGRTTGKTTGKIEDVHFRFTLDYEGDVGVVGFIDQVLCTRYTDEGDSGSLVVEKATGRAVGLHFAGAEGGSVFSPIDEVLKTLGVKLVTKALAKSVKTKPAKKAGSK
ncbi:MAG TPA: hypothetical protein VIT19_04380 [Pyrinomonadaceae bacterium]